MIRQIRIQNYKALRDVTLDLTPIHALIGPNDSGKTSILEAVQALCRSVDYPLQEAFTGSWTSNELVWQRQTDSPVTFRAALEDVKEEAKSASGYVLSCSFEQVNRMVTLNSEQIRIDGLRDSPTVSWTSGGKSRSFASEIIDQPNSPEWEKCQHIHQSLSGVRFYRWQPHYLAMPVAQTGETDFSLSQNGFGLAVCFDNLLGYDLRKAAELQERFLSFFEHIQAIRVRPASGYVLGPRHQAEGSPEVHLLDEKRPGKEICFRLAEGKTIPASQASDGALLVLAYLTLLYLPREAQPRVLLIEEPENGIHPARLRNVLTILRELIKEQTHTQVILTTHSPYVLDLFQPDEVTLCMMGKDGAVSTHNLSESEVVQKQAGIFTLGEIWTGEGDEKLAETCEEERP